VANGILSWEAEAYKEDKTITLTDCTVPTDVITNPVSKTIRCVGYTCKTIQSVDGWPAKIEIRTIYPNVYTPAQVDIIMFIEGLGTSYTPVTTKILPANNREIEVNYIEQHGVQVREDREVWAQDITRTSFTNSGIFAYQYISVGPSARAQFLYYPDGTATFVATVKDRTDNQVYTACEIIVRGENS